MGSGDANVIAVASSPVLQIHFSLSYTREFETILKFPEIKIDYFPAFFTEIIEILVNICPVPTPKDTSASNIT